MTKINELAAMVAGTVEGDGELEIIGLNDLEQAGPGELAFLANASLAGKLAQCRASALLVGRKAADKLAPPAGLTLVWVDEPYLAATKIQNFLLARPFVATGVDPAAVIGEGCHIPAEVSIAPGVVLGRGVRLGRAVRLEAGVVVGDEVTIGDEVVIYPNVTIYPRTSIGHRVIIHSGSVLGSDGFGYATDPQGRHHKRLHLGVVRIEDEVEIGANCCIDRGTFGETVIGAGSKLDNLVQIGHNVKVGENALLVAQVGIAGSTVLERQVVLGGQTALSGHLKIGAGVMVAAKSGVHNDQPPGAVVAGFPAVNHKKWLRTSAALGRLPELLREMRDLRRQVAALKAESADSLPVVKESGNKGESGDE